MPIGLQIIWLFVLAIPIACVSWTITHEEIFKEPREFFAKYSKSGKTVLVRKFFYLLTCEYCFSHYVTILFLIITKYTLLIPDWRGYIIAGFALVWVANIYMSLFSRIRVDIKAEKQNIELNEKIAENNNFK